MKQLIILHVKTSQNSGLEAPKSRSGGLESSPGGGLGASWAAPGSKTPPRRLLKASWAALGPSWGPLGGEHGSNKAPKMEPKSNTNRYKNQTIFWYPLGGLYSSMLVDFWCQHGVQIAPKWSQISIWIGKHRFLWIDRFTVIFIA